MTREHAQLIERKEVINRLGGLGSVTLKSLPDFLTLTRQLKPFRFSKLSHAYESIQQLQRTQLFERLLGNAKRPENKAETFFGQTFRDQLIENHAPI